MDIPAVILALASLVASVATLVTALRTHAAVRTSNGQSIGQMVEATGEAVLADRVSAAVLGGRRAGDVAAVVPTTREDPLA